MNPCLRVTVVVFGSAALAFVLSAMAPAQEVWTGLTYSFTKLPYTDPSDPLNQDAITPNVALTRDTVGGVYNAAYETAYALGSSPEYTEWATNVMPENAAETISAANWANLAFADWRTAYGGAPVLATNITTDNAVVHLVLDDIYVDLQFTDWSQGFGGGGGFSYVRAEPPEVPEPAAWSLLVAGLLGCGLFRRRPRNP